LESSSFLKNRAFIPHRLWGIERRLACMKVGIIFTGTGPILILTTYESFKDPKLISKLEAKGIKKYIAAELPLERVKEK